MPYEKHINTKTGTIEFLPFNNLVTENELRILPAEKISTVTSEWEKLRARDESTNLYNYRIYNFPEMNSDKLLFITENITFEDLLTATLSPNSGDANAAVIGKYRTNIERRETAELVNLLAILKQYATEEIRSGIGYKVTPELLEKIPGLVNFMNKARLAYLASTII
jgi:hypothetical protein